MDTKKLRLIIRNIISDLYYNSINEVVSTDQSSSIHSVGSSINPGSSIGGSKINMNSTMNKPAEGRGASEVNVTGGGMYRDGKKMYFDKTGEDKSHLYFKKGGKSKESGGATGGGEKTSGLKQGGNIKVNLQNKSIVNKPYSAEKAKSKD